MPWYGHFSFVNMAHPSQNAVFDSCILLLLSVWGRHCFGLTIDPQKCLQDVEACLRVFRVYETRSVSEGVVFAPTDRSVDGSLLDANSKPVGSLWFH